VDKLNFQIRLIRIKNFKRESERDYGKRDEREERERERKRKER
jgi:hypothetical protein